MANIPSTLVSSRLRSPASLTSVVKADHRVAGSPVAFTVAVVEAVEGAAEVDEAVRGGRKASRMANTTTEPTALTRAIC